MRRALFDDIVAAADEQAIISCAGDFQFEEMPETAVQLKPAIARRKRLSREIKDRLFGSKGRDILWLARGSIVAPSYGHRNREVICASAHENRSACRNARHRRGQRSRLGHTPGIGVGPVGSYEQVTGINR